MKSNFTFATLAIVLVDMAYSANITNDSGNVIQSGMRRKLDINITGFGYICTREEVHKIKSSSPIPNSICPSRNWIEPFSETVRIESKSPVVISVGCNKGDDFMVLLNKMSGDASYNFKNYIAKLKAKGAGSSCDFGSPDKVESVEKPKIIYGYCLEPVVSNINLIEGIFKEMKLDSDKIKIIKMAVNSYTGSATFPKVMDAGVEYVGLETSKNFDNSDIVPMSNLDTIVSEHKIGDIIDFVSIDTEGYDAEVIIGFIKTLVTKYVRGLEFEYHLGRRWKTADLLMVITILDVLNYDCYWQGNKGELWRLTGCWHHDYWAGRSLSNVVCINRKERSHAWFEKESKKYM